MGRQKPGKSLRLQVTSTGICFYCRKNTSKKERTVDHIIPTSQGGDVSKLTNLVMACFDCNQYKAEHGLARLVETKTPETEKEKVTAMLVEKTQLVAELLFSVVRH